MAEVSKVRRLVNPGRKKRKLSPLQKLFFGSKRQRASVKTNRGKRKKKNYGTRAGRSWSTYKVKGKKRNPSKRRKRNVSSIITIWPKGNPGRKRRYRRKNTSKRRRNRSRKSVVVINKGVKMARRRTRRANNPSRRKRYARQRNFGRRRYAVRRRRRSNPGAVRHRQHRSVVRHRRHYRRSNPGVLSGTMGRIAGVIGGIAVTKILAGFIPASFATGIIGNIATAVVAVAQGKLIGKVSKNAALGNDFMVGGLAYAVATFLNSMFPSIGSYTGISGMGLIGGSQFYVPQVNMPGNMGTFVPVGRQMMATAHASGMGAMRGRRNGRIM